MATHSNWIDDERVEGLSWRTSAVLDPAPDPAGSPASKRFDLGLPVSE